MLFDLRGKRKRMIQVIYVGLALLMGIGLIGLGIGSNTSGGLFDALGIGSDGSSGDPTYESQIDRANEALQSNPKDERALLSLARYEFLSAQAEREPTDNGGFQLTENAVNSYGEAADAWERYLATKPKQPNDDVASLMVQAYQVVYSTDTSLQEQTLDKLVGAAQIVADARPSLGTYTDLATFAYFAGDEKLAADAKKKALAAAPDDTTRKQVQQGLAQAQSQAAALAKQQKQQQAAGAQGSGQLPSPTTLTPGQTTPAP